MVSTGSFIGLGRTDIFKHSTFKAEDISLVLLDSAVQKDDSSIGMLDKGL